MIGIKRYCNAVSFIDLRFYGIKSLFIKYIIALFILTDSSRQHKAASEKCIRGWIAVLCIDRQCPFEGGAVIISIGIFIIHLYAFINGAKA